VSVKKTDLDSSANTTKDSGTNSYNYSVDVMKKAAFVDEVNNVLIHCQKTVASEIIIAYIKNRISEIDARHK
jgi:hypothetical protein